MRAFILAVLLAAGVALCAPAAAAAPSAIDEGALVRVVNVAPTTDAVDVHLGHGVPQQLVFGSATTFVRVPAGNAISVNGTAVTLREANAGCMDTVIVGSGARVAELSECEPVRVSSGSASVRFVNATTDSGEVLSSASGGVAVPPFTAAPRISLTAGQVDVEVTSPAGERLGDREVQAEPDVAYTALWAGGGEIPLRVLWVEDGRQPHDPPPVDEPIDTDAQGVPSTVGANVAICVIGLVLLAVLGALRRRALPLVAALAAVLGALRRRALPLVAALALLAACTQPGPGDVRSAPTVAGHPAVPPVTQPDETGVADPAHLSVPVAEISARIEAVDHDAGPELPHVLSGADVAWFNGTSRPGDRGVAVLAGHVVWAGGPGVFATLGEAEPGSTFEVTSADGVVRTFTVVGKSVFHKASLDASLFAFTPERRVLLVTCSGAIDPQRGLRSENLVVLAFVPEPVGVVGG